MIVRMVLLALVLTGCTSRPATPGTESENNVRRHFEAAIAREIISEIRSEFPLLKGSTRAQFLRQKTEQFRHHVDLSAITGSLRREFELLQYLADTEEQYWHSADFASLLQARASFPVDVAAIERNILEELKQIDLTLAVLVADEFKLDSHMASVREKARYPEDSFTGRQQYLDKLGEAMADAHAEWQPLIRSIDDVGIALEGTEATQQTFLYHNETLLIGLSNVRDLPEFELKAIAVYWGFPGRSVLTESDDRYSLRGIISLPGYTLGWSGYMLDLVAARDVKHTRDYLYFAKLLTSLALADLRVNRSEWSLAEAEQALYQSTPYSRNRVRQMLNTVSVRPGYFAAAFAGKQKISELQSRCTSDCDTGFHQVVIDEGPIPFPILELRLIEKGLVGEN